MKVWLLLLVSFVVVSVLMGLIAWASGVSSSFRKSKKENPAHIKFSDYLGKYLLFNMNVLTTHGRCINSLPYLTYN